MKKSLLHASKIRCMQQVFSVSVFPAAAVLFVVVGGMFYFFGFSLRVTFM